MFPLIRFIASAPESGVFETQYTDRRPMRVAVKLIPAGAPAAADALDRWKASSELTHPNLLRIFAGGECEIEGMLFVYLVTELADDDLSLVLAERALTVQEAREMLTPVVTGLAFLHGRGFAHGAIKPSNVLALGEEVKLSLDRAIQGGDVAEDCHALGMMLQLQVLPAPLPSPFDEIVKGCLDLDPASRWTAAHIAARLKQGMERPSARRSPSLVVIASAVVLSLILIALWRQRSSPEPAAPAPAVTQSGTQNSVEPAATATRKQATTPSPAPPAAAVNRAAPTRPETGGIPDVVRRILPEIPERARNTIEGRVRINVKVTVDSEGNVTEASAQPPAASRYFTERVIVAANDWKFVPLNGVKTPREFLLRFQLTRTETSVSAVAAERVAERR